MKKNEWLKKNLWIWLIVIATINPVLFIFKSPLILYTKKIPVSPLPLVFDSPQNFTFWAYKFKVIYESENDSSKEIIIDNKFTQAQPRSFMLNAFYFIIIGGTLIDPQHIESQKYLKQILCNGSLQVFKYVSLNDKILKVKIQVYNENKKIREQEFLCW